MVNKCQSPQVVFWGSLGPERLCTARDCGTIYLQIINFRLYKFRAQLIMILLRSEVNWRTSYKTRNGTVKQKRNETKRTEQETTPKILILQTVRHACAGLDCSFKYESPQS